MKTVTGYTIGELIEMGPLEAFALGFQNGAAAKEKEMLEFAEWCVVNAFDGWIELNDGNHIMSVKEAYAYWKSKREKGEG